MKKLLIPLGIILVVALVICLAPLKTVAYTAVVDYQDTETYYEDEPYETTETYYEDEPYVNTETYFEEVPLAYEVELYIRQVKGTETKTIQIGDYKASETEVGYLDIACVSVTNTDVVEGIFRVSISVIEPTFGWTNPDPEEKLDMFPNRRLTLAPGQTGIAQCAADELGDWSYTITPSTKPVKRERNIVKYREVEKQRIVTEYRQVEKERTVWKERLETRDKKVTLFDYLIRY